MSPITETSPPAVAEPILSAALMWALLGVVLVADAMDLLDATVTTIAAPTIAVDLSGGPALIKWLSAAYALALGTLLFSFTAALAVAVLCALMFTATCVGLASLVLVPVILSTTARRSPASRRRAISPRA